MQGCSAKLVSLSATDFPLKLNPSLQIIELTNGHWGVLVTKRAVPFPNVDLFFVWLPTQLISLEYTIFVGQDYGSLFSLRSFNAYCGTELAE